MSNLSITDFEYTQDEILTIIVTNIFKMLENRKLMEFNTHTNSTLINKVKTNLTNSSYYKFQTDNRDRDNISNYMIILTDENIDKISKNTNVYNFMVKFPSEHKIIITSSITKNTDHQIFDFPNAEIFPQSYFMINLIDNNLVPKHELLYGESINIIKNEYNTPLNKFPKIFVTDPVSKYYNARKYDLFRITRPSNISGESISYRFVIKGK